MEVTTKILQVIKSIVTLTQEEEEAFVNILEVKNLNKKDFLLRGGEVCNKISYINSGCLRAFYEVDGNFKNN